MSSTRKIDVLQLNYECKKNLDMQFKTPDLQILVL